MSTDSDGVEHHVYLTEEEFSDEDLQNHPSSPCCFGSGVAHKDVSGPFLRGVGDPLQMCV